jgi:heterodisulfide reductase subunit A-like polyferredoxin
MTASLRLAEQGFEVHLIEKEKDLLADRLDREVRPRAVAG